VSIFKTYNENVIKKFIYYAINVSPILLIVKLVFKPFVIKWIEFSTFSILAILSQVSSWATLAWT